MARVHRIGQTKTVQIYKLCTKGTYENHMLKLANQKLGDPEPQTPTPNS